MVHRGVAAEVLIVGGALGRRYAITLLDIYGNKEILFRNPLISCATPTWSSIRNVFCWFEPSSELALFRVTTTACVWRGVRGQARRDRGG